MGSMDSMHRCRRPGRQGGCRVPACKTLALSLALTFAQPLPFLFASARSLAGCMKDASCTALLRG